MLPPLLGPLALGVSTPQKGANGAFFDPIVQPELELADGIQAAVPAAVASAVAEAVASSPVMFRLQHEQSADIHRESPVPEAFDNRRVTKFVVLSQARSGSTWLNTMLNAHPRILAYGEYLSPYAGIRAYVNDGWDCEPMRRLERRVLAVAAWIRKQADPCLHCALSGWRMRAFSRSAPSGTMTRNASGSPRPGMARWR